MQIKAGSYYRRRDGGVEGPLSYEPGGDSTYPWLAPNGERWTPSGREFTHHRDSDGDLIREVFITDKPPQVCPELKAGGKYETVKPDGTPGPVLKLRKNTQHTTYIDSAYRQFCPFLAESPGDDERSFVVGTRGDVVRYNGTEFYTITREYVEPKPPSLAERLEKWRNDASKSYAEIDSIISDVRKLEASK